jgi:hypothetical protein
MTNETQDDLFDPAKFRVTDAELPGILAAVPTKKQPKRRQPFTQYPINWGERLKGATGPTVLTTIVIQFLHWKGGGRPFKLPNGGILKSFGVSRHSKWRALCDLEKRGLIVVERRRRKSPIVTVLP